MDLSQLLASTYDPISQKEAEATLHSLSTQPGFTQSLFGVIAQNDFVCQAGCIYLKNLVSKATHFADFKHGLTSCLASVTLPAARTQILAAISKVLSHEHASGAWPEYLPAVQAMISTQSNVQVMHAGLLGLLELVKNYQWVATGPKRQMMHTIVSSCFPPLLQIANHLMATDDPRSFDMLHVIIKTYQCSIRMELSKHQQDSASLVPWGNLFVTMIQKSTPADSRNEALPFWKAKKWAMRCLDTLFARYTCSLKKDKRYTQFSAMFSTQFAPVILQTYINDVNGLSNGSWMTTRCKHLLANFIEEAIKPKVTWAVVKPHVEFIITRFIYPQLCATREDEELFDEDPIEYIHLKVDNSMDDYKTPAVAAEYLLQRIIRDRPKQTFQLTVTLIYQLFDKIANQDVSLRNPAEKYGALKMICAIRDDVMSEDSPIKSQLQSFMATHVFPELSSPTGYLRSMALFTLREFAEVEYHPESLQFLFHSILTLIKDPELAVQVSAALTLAPFVQVEGFREGLRPHAAGIMQELLNLTNAIDMDTLTSVMEQLVFRYSEELTPFAVQLAAQLRDTFLRIMGDEKQEVELEEAEERTMTAMGICKTISSLILAVDASPEIVLQIETVIAPVLDYILRNCVLDLYEEAFEIMESTTFCSKSVSNIIWALFPYIYKNFKDDALDYIEEIMPTLDNIIVFGSAVIASNPGLQEQLVEMIMAVMKTDGGEEISESDRCRACQIMECMMLNLKGSIDAHIPRFIELAYTYLSKKIKTPAFKVHAIEIVINALFYNPRMTLELLDRIHWVVPFFQTWMGALEQFVRVHDKKLSILALMAVLDAGVGQGSVQGGLPASCQDLTPQFFFGILKVFETYQDALDERKREEEMGEEGSDDETGEVEDEDEINGHDLHQQDDDDEEEEEFMHAIEKMDHPEDPDTDDESCLDFDDLLYEDIYFCTILDQIDAYIAFEKLMAMLASGGSAALLEPLLSDGQRVQISGLLVKSNEAKALTHSK